MRLVATFTDHPASVGETYGQHFARAAGFGLTMVAGGLACLVHALVPRFFPATASGIVGSLHQRMAARSARGAADRA
jgi:hypothetical protein